MIARRPAILLTAAILLALCVLASLFVGSSRIPAGQVAHYLLHPDASNVSYNINVLRVQRTIMGVLVGTALAVAGAVMQAVTRNPLAEPGLLGVNAGASLGIVLGTAVLGVLPISNQLALAAGGALVATALVQVIGMIGASSSSPVRLVLIGVAFSAFAGAVIRGVVLTMPNLFRTFIDWEVGSLTRTDIPLLPVAALVVAGTGAAVLLAGALDNIALGDDVASGLGVRASRTRLGAVIAITLLAGSATAITGGLAFIGLMIPHVVRWSLGPDQRLILTGSLLAAPALVLMADSLGRVIAAPGEIEVGILTAVIGAPLLVTQAWKANP